MAFAISRRFLLLAILAISCLAQAQQSERFGPYELHYSVVNSTFLDPAIAATYGIKRGRNNAMLNLALRENVENGTAPRAMQLQGSTWDAIHKQPLQFREIREGDSLYYIAEFSFLDEELRWFEIDFLPTGEKRSLHFKFSHQLYVH